MDTEIKSKLERKSIMRLVFTTFILFVSIISFSQKVSKILDKCDIAKFIKHLDKGGDLNEKIKDYDDNDEVFEVGLLTYAVHAECLPCIELMVERKNEIEDFDLEVTGAFVFSLSVGNDEISNFLYEQSPIPHGICDVCHGNNALMVATTYGREEWYFKLKPNADLSYINTSNANLYHCAATGPSQTILEDVLTIKELDINRKDNQGMTPLDDAASNEENPLAYQTILEAGCDYYEAWNLIYWWSMYPYSVPTPEMIENRRADVWMIDEHGENALMLLSYFYADHEDIEAGVFKAVFSTILNIMIEDHKEDKSDLSFVPQFYSDGITMNFLNAMLYIEDFDSDEPIYPKYLEFLGMLCADSEFCPVYKKEFKTACKIYGEESVKSWYEEYGIPEE